MIKNVICPDEQRCSVEQCMTKCRMAQRCVPYVYAAVASRQRKWDGIPSVTQLLNGTRESYLRITRDYDIDLRDSAFMLLGTSAHKLLEDINSQQLSEHIVAREKHLEYNGIQGTFDLIEKWGDDTVLIDHKTFGSYVVAKMLGLVEEKVPKSDGSGAPLTKGGKVVYEKRYVYNKDAVDKFEYQMQLNMYRIMIKNCLDINITKMYNFIIVRDGGTFIATNRGIDEKVYLVLQEFLPDDFVLSYFEHKKEALLKALETNEMPPLCDQRENWGFRKCELFCSVSSYCDWKSHIAGSI